MSDSCAFERLVPGKNCINIETGNQELLAAYEFLVQYLDVYDFVVSLKM